MIKTLGLIAAAVLPLWNVPLILHIDRRKSSKDISSAWAYGVFICMVGILPSGLASNDPVFKTYIVLNMILFTGVVIQVIRYR